MTRKEALKILSLPTTATEREIRKQYHRLLHRVHPDALSLADESCAGGILEIIQAYSVLKKNGAAPETAPGTGWQHSGKKPGNMRQGAGTCSSRRTAAGSENSSWNAPVNENAWMEREILHYAEDSQGSVIGSFTLARGKYLWTPDEDFPLFLQSMFRCSKELLDETDDLLCREPPSFRPQYQAELCYLLAQQFMDSTALLKTLARKTVHADGSEIWYISSMLESERFLIKPEPGDLLFPSGIRRHRLYVKNADGQELGYLSFRDDRFYYVVVPLFEQKRVRVRIKAADPKTEKSRRLSAGFTGLHLWLKIIDQDISRPPESLSLQIEALLDSYRKAG